LSSSRTRVAVRPSLQCACTAGKEGGEIEGGEEGGRRGGREEEWREGGEGGRQW